MKLAVTDANIFIDLFHIGLIDELFELDIELFTTIEVIFELKEKDQDKLSGISGLVIIKSDDPDYLEGLANNLSSSLTPADLSVFHYARKTNAGILTGDSLLRRISEEQGFEVHGIIWILDELVTSTAIQCAIAIQKLEKLMEFNKRLPSRECEKILRKWHKLRNEI